MPLIIMVACSPRPNISVEILPDYEALFTNEKGWTGADGAYSIMLSNEKILWLFGDTWIGRIKGGRHIDATIVNNSIALQHGRRAANASVEFYYGQTQNDKPAAFFRPRQDQSWFWIYHGARTSKGLFLFLMQMERTDEQAAFGFKLIGSWLGSVDNPEDPPPAWHVRMQKIPWATFKASGNTFFGSALLHISDYFYIYGITEGITGGITEGITEEIGKGVHRKYMIVARVPETGLDDFDQWRFFGNGRWTADPSEVSRLCGNMANEYSVSYQPELRKYIAVYSENGISRNIVARLASQPYGPWSAPMRLYQCPEVEWDKDFFCYAAKAHPDISLHADELIMTYVANSTDFQKVADDTRLYRPRFLRVRFLPSNKK
ncbi:MAG: DUF4185 domain-containing protein [Desulfobacteraceae bacterium]